LQCLGEWTIRGDAHRIFQASAVRLRNNKNRRHGKLLCGKLKRSYLQNDSISNSSSHCADLGQ